MWGLKIYTPTPLPGKCLVTRNGWRGWGVCNFALDNSERAESAPGRGLLQDFCYGTLTNFCTGPKTRRLDCLRHDTVTPNRLVSSLSREHKFWGQGRIDTTSVLCRVFVCFVCVCVCVCASVRVHTCAWASVCENH